MYEDSFKDKDWSDTASAPSLNSSDSNLFNLEWDEEKESTSGSEYATVYVQ